MFFEDYQSLAQFSDQKMQKVNLFESHRMFMDLYCLLPGQEQKPHTHPDNDKVYFILEGTVLCRIAGQERELAADCSCVAPAGVLHGIRNNSGRRAVVLVVMSPRPEHV